MDKTLKFIRPDMEKRYKKICTARKIFMFLAIIPPFMIGLMVYMSRKAKCEQIFMVRDIIYAQEKTLLFSVFGYYPHAADFVQRMIDTGNIRGYRIVADVMAVKDGVEMSEDDAMAAYSSQMTLPLAVAYKMKLPVVKTDSGPADGSSA